MASSLIRAFLALAILIGVAVSETKIRQLRCGRGQKCGNGGCGVYQNCWQGGCGPLQPCGQNGCGQPSNCGVSGCGQPVCIPEPPCDKSEVCWNHADGRRSCATLSCANGIRLTVVSPDRTVVSIKAVRSAQDLTELPCGQSSSPWVAPRPPSEAEQEHDASIDYLMSLGLRSEFDDTNRDYSEWDNSQPESRNGVTNVWMANSGPCGAKPPVSSRPACCGEDCFGVGPVFVVVTEYLYVNGIVDLVTKTIVEMTCSVCIEQPPCDSVDVAIKPLETTRCQRTKYSLAVNEVRGEYNVAIREVSHVEKDNQVGWRLQCLSYSNDQIVNSGVVVPSNSAASEIGAVLTCRAPTPRTEYDLVSDAVVDLVGPRFDDLPVSAVIEYCEIPQHVGSAITVLSRTNCKGQAAC